jgi:hypothetical protein
MAEVLFITCALRALLALHALPGLQYNLERKQRSDVNIYSSSKQFASPEIRRNVGLTSI